MARPSLISSSVATLMASRPGERLKTFAMPVASCRRFVRERDLGQELELLVGPRLGHPDRVVAEVVGQLRPMRSTVLRS